ncbi:MAG TPA: tyrosine-type recombinase/integrase, partial [Roseiarcus sp.]|nr:tyrosine-type recombinase/integrase [Roseiarcus sp.]
RWRLAYRFRRAQKTLAIGVYPEVSLKDARDARDAARRVLARGDDPVAVKKAAKAAKADEGANTFSTVAGELAEKKWRDRKAAATLRKFDWFMSFAFPALGSRPIHEISAREVLAVLKEVEARGTHETAHKLRTAIGDVFRFAIATARAENDPTGALRGALVAPTVKPRAAIVVPRAFGGLLRAIENYDGTAETRYALELLALTFVRPGELRAAEWTEFDLHTAVWEIPAGRMKMRKPHRVPLAPRALAILEQLRILTGKDRFLFPSARSVTRCMSENTLNAALRRMGFTNDDMTSHGFRASASSMLNESGLWNPDAIERQLAHVEPDAVRRAYARADFWDERVRMMNWWADKCDELRRGGEVVAFPSSAAS